MPRLGSVTVENRDAETIFNAAGLDFDVLKASAIAYINANTFVQKENAGEMGRSVLTAICLVCKENAMTKKIIALAGGIGPEIMEAGLEVLEALAEKTGFDYD